MVSLRGNIKFWGIKMRDNCILTIAISNLVVLWLVYLRLWKPQKVINVYEYSLKLISDRLLEISKKLDNQVKDKKDSQRQNKVIAKNNLLISAEIIKNLKSIDKKLK